MSEGGRRIHDRQHEGEVEGFTDFPRFEVTTTLLDIASSSGSMSFLGMEVPGQIWVAAVFVFLVLQFLLNHLLDDSVTYPVSIPVVGTRKELFRSARASFRQLTNGITTLTTGYSKYSKCGLPFLLHEPSFKKEVMIPPEQIKWFSTQSDSVLSSTEIRKERHAVRYLHIGVEFDTTVFFLERFIGETLTKNLDKLQKPLVEEISEKTDEIFGVDEHQWKTLNVYNTLQDIILPAMSRVFFGLPLGRDSKFLKSFKHYVLAMGVGTIVIGQLPRIFKGLLVPLFNVPLRFYRAKTMKTLVPMVERQLIETQNATASLHEEKYDLISQSARVSAKLSAIRNVADPSMIAEWILLLGFAALSSTIIQASNLLLDIISSSSETQALELIREEAAALLQCDDDWINPGNFRKMILCDSAIRETARYHPILIKGLTKEVVRPGGLDLPDGTHIPRGGWLGVPVLGLHLDERFYPNPEKYDPFRSVKAKRERENAQIKEDGGGERTKVSFNDLDAGQPTSTYVGFGYGRHACPGRWFAVQLLKILLAHITLNYEIEATGPQPKTKVIGDAALPPTSATIRVRRRKQKGNMANAILTECK